VAVISMAIFPFFTWQARQAYPFVDNTYRLVSDSQFRANNDLLDLLSLKLEGVSMCDLNEGLQAIADAMVTASQTRKADNVSVSQNCGGSCGCGGGGGGGNPFGLGFTGNIGPFQGSGSGGYTINGGPLPPLSVGYGELGEGDPPEGFATWDEYRVYKCQCAFAVYTTIHATFSALCSQAAIASLGLIVQTGLELGAVVNWVVTAIRFGSFGFSGGQVTAVIFSTNGPVLAASIILGAAVALIAEAAILEQVGAEIEANKDDIICALYKSGSAGQAVSDVTDILQDLLIGLAMPETVAGVLVGVFENIFSPNVLDGLFRVAFDFAWPDADCDSCDESACNWEWVSDREGWTWQQTQGPTGYCEGIWSALLNNEGQITNRIDATAGTGVYELLWRSPTIDCVGNRINFAIGSEYSLLSTWRIVVTYQDNETEEQSFPDGGVATHYTMILTPTANIKRVDVYYIGDYYDESFGYVASMFNMAIYTV
jgi:hypothetical protein